MWWSCSKTQWASLPEDTTNGSSNDSSVSAGLRGERQQERMTMIDRTIRARGIDDARVLQAMMRVPRHGFVPDRFQSLAYSDQPLPIGEGQTISQPYIVALMTEQAQIEPGTRCLEIGTGCGYQ